MRFYKQIKNMIKQIKNYIGSINFYQNRHFQISGGYVERIPRLHPLAITHRHNFFKIFEN